LSRKGKHKCNPPETDRACVLGRNKRTGRIKLKENNETREELCCLIKKRKKKKKSRGCSCPTTMPDKQIIPPPHDLDAKWDACLDLTVRRFVYSSTAGAFAGLLFFSQYLISFFLMVSISEQNLMFFCCF